jgi:hypothetical protein
MDYLKGILKLDKQEILIKKRKRALRIKVLNRELSKLNSGRGDLVELFDSLIGEIGKIDRNIEKMLSNVVIMRKKKLGLGKEVKKLRGDIRRIDFLIKKKSRKLEKIKE